jgi:hypothetical protein
MPSFLLTSRMRPLMGAPGASSPSTCKILHFFFQGPR